MAMFGAMAASASGLTVFRTFLDATSNNIANMQSMGDTADGTTDAFKTELVVAQAGAEGDGSRGARVTSIERRADEMGRPVFDPEHPYADENGIVTYPGVDLSEQMVNMVVAQRGYQANVTAIQYARDAYQAALRLGR